MSASLVGSEMCIRDRPPGTQGAGLLPEAEARQECEDLESPTPTATVNSHRGARARCAPGR
eukprot:8692990-Alexandrium_andersonii.AAC.1